MSGPLKQLCLLNLFTYFVTGNWSPSKCKITELFKASVVVQELALLEQASTVLGGVVIFDLAGLSLTHVWHMTPAIAETMMELLVVRYDQGIVHFFTINRTCRDLSYNKLQCGGRQCVTTTLD